MLKNIVFGSLLALLGATEDLCPSARQQECQNDIIKAYTVCLEAAKQKGQDQQADINLRKECWPCVCEIAKQEGWKVKGCDLFSNIRSA